MLEPETRGAKSPMKLFEEKSGLELTPHLKPLYAYLVSKHHLPGKRNHEDFRSHHHRSYPYLHRSYWE